MTFDDLRIKASDYENFLRSMDFEDIESLYILTCIVEEKMRSKIGVSVDPKKRLKSIQGMNAVRVEKYKFYLASELNFNKISARFIESEIKEKFKNKRSHEYSTEWLLVDPSVIETAVEKLIIKDRNNRNNRYKKRKKKNDEFKKSLDPFYTIEGLRN